MDLLHEMLEATAAARPDAPALTDRAGTFTYAQITEAVEATAAGLIEHGLRRGDRVAVWLPKRSEKAIALYGAMRAGGVAVPVNALLKAPQVAHILRDSDATVLVTTAARLVDLAREMPDLAGLRAIVTVDDPTLAGRQHCVTLGWEELLAAPPQVAPTMIDTDVAAIFYTSGSTGKPKGVVLSHRNLVAGARSVSGYLGNTPDDRLLAVLSFSFDYGFSQLTTAFAVGASVVLLDYLLPQEVLLTLDRERITGLAAVPPIWIQLADLRWPEGVRQTLRYVTNSGGAMPRATLAKLRQTLPQTRVFLMYGLTEAFRSTYLPPEEVDRRPDSIGKAIPRGRSAGAEARRHAVRRGRAGRTGPSRLVGVARLLERPGTHGRALSARAAGGKRPTAARACGLVRRHRPARRGGFSLLHRSPRRDDQDLRVSSEPDRGRGGGLCNWPRRRRGRHRSAARSIGTRHRARSLTPQGTAADTDSLLAALRRRLPRYMVPLAIDWREMLPRNANGKFDRERLRQELATRFIDVNSRVGRHSDCGTMRVDGRDSWRFALAV